MTTKQEKYKKVAYYPGCALEGTGHSYNRSTKAVGKALGLATFFRPKTSGWGRARAAIGEYVEEREAANRKVLGLGTGGGE